MYFSCVLAVLIASFSPGARGAEPAGQKSPRLLVHLLDYLAKDYAGAVTPQGQIISASEYKEQQEFAESADETGKSLAELADHPGILAAVARVRQLVEAKAPPAEVAKASRDAQAQVIAATHLPTAPARWPSLGRGREL